MMSKRKQRTYHCWRSVTNDPLSLFSQNYAVIMVAKIKSRIAVLSRIFSIRFIYLSVHRVFTSRYDVVHVFVRSPKQPRNNAFPLIVLRQTKFEIVVFKFPHSDVACLWCEHFNLSTFDYPNTCGTETFNGLNVNIFMGLQWKHVI